MINEQPPVRKPLTEAQQAALERGRVNQRLRGQGLLPPVVRKPRGRGRKPTRAPRSKPAAIPRMGGETAPLRPATPVLSAKQRENVKQALNLAIAGADQAASTFAPALWSKEDQLVSDETLMLTEAIYGELECWPPVLKALAEFTVVTSAHGFLGACLAAVAAPRLARRGLISDQLATRIAFLPFIISAASTGDHAVPVAAEPTPGGGGSEWSGQEHANGVGAGYPASVQSDFQEQTG